MTKQPYKRVAYDLDGVLMPLLKRCKPFYQYNGEERKAYEKTRLQQYANDIKLRTPEEPEFYIISARQEKYRTVTEEWLRKNNINALEVLLMDAALTFENVLNHKHKWLVEKKIEKYYEDDPKLIKELQKLLPELEIVAIPRTSENVKVDVLPISLQKKL